MASFLYDTIVTVLVGPEKDYFAIHKTLVCGQSDFFKAALTGNFKEADGTIALPERDPATFKYFVYWLYTGSLRGLYYPETTKPTLAEIADKLRTEMASRDVSNVNHLRYDNAFRKAWEHAQCRDLPFTSLVSLYILADALQVQGLRDPIITALIEVYGLNTPWKKGANPYWDVDQSDCLKRPTRSINMAWEALQNGSNLCKLLVQLFCDSTLHIARHCIEEELHPEFVIAVGEEYAKRWFGNSPTSQWTTTGAICAFHEHDEDTCALSKMYLEDRKRMASR